jgi:hypothetical protein
MHTCLSLSNVDCHSRVEDDVAELADRLNAFCDSIDSCHISVEQPTGESGERYWRLALNLRIFDESVRATSCQPTGPHPARSLAGVLDDVYTRAIDRMTQIARRRHCCCAGLAHDVATTACKECA